MKPTNLLFLFTDEQRADTMAAYGNRRIDTPNFNRLADESVVFDRAYVTQPVCTPSRSSIMTGLYPHTTGCTENNLSLSAEIPTLAEMLAPDVYATGYVGKWHLGDEIFAQHGFDEWRSIEDMYVGHYSAGRDRDARSTYHHWLCGKGMSPGNGSRFTRGETARLPEACSKPAYLAEEASRFIRENRRRPFCLYVNFLEPHMPFFGPRDGQYDPATVPLPTSFSHPPTDDQPLKTRLLHRAYNRPDGTGPFGLATEDDWRRLISNYWGLCSLVDTHVGTILQTLTDCGLDGNTLVVYTSDHGDMMGSHGLVAKCVMFEEAVRVPLMIRLPGQKTGRRVDGAVSQIDLVPTLLDLMGQPVPDGLEGRSLGSLPAELEDLREDVFIEWNGPNSGIGPDVLGKTVLPSHLRGVASAADAEAAVADPVRSVVTSDGWKFNCSPRGDHELYSLNEDPWELDNLAFDPGMQPMMSDLLGRIRTWQQRTGDEIELPDPPYSRTRGNTDE